MRWHPREARRRRVDRQPRRRLGGRPGLAEQRLGTRVRPRPTRRRAAGGPGLRARRGPRGPGRDPAVGDGADLLRGRRCRPPRLGAGARDAAEPAHPAVPPGAPLHGARGHRPRAADRQGRPGRCAARRGSPSAVGRASAVAVRCRRTLRLGPRHAVRLVRRRTGCSERRRAPRSGRGSARRPARTALAGLARAEIAPGGRRPGRTAGPQRAGSHWEIRSWTWPPCSSSWPTSPIAGCRCRCSSRPQWPATRRATYRWTGGGWGCTWRTSDWPRRVGRLMPCVPTPSPGPAAIWRPLGRRCAGSTRSDRGGDSQRIRRRHDS